MHLFPLVEIIKMSCVEGCTAIPEGKNSTLSATNFLKSFFSTNRNGPGFNSAFFTSNSYTARVVFFSSSSPDSFLQAIKRFPDTGSYARPSVLFFLSRNVEYSFDWIVDLQFHILKTEAWLHNA